MRRISVVFVLALVLALLVPFLALAAPPLAEQLAPFETFAAEEMARDRMPGLSVAVLRGNELWAKGFGFADLENRVPASPESSYRMASVTKPMTAVAALRLAEKGMLDLDAPVRTWLPWFPDKGHPITVRQLLAHLGGISHYRDYLAEGFIREPKTTREAIAIFENFDLAAEPGTRYVYSSYGYNLVGAVLEAAAGKPYGELMRELVWEPAGMSATRMDDPSAIIPHRVRGYRLDDGRLRNSDYVNVSSRFAAGGTRSTVIDMVRFAEAVSAGRLLSDEMMRAMWWPQSTTEGRWIHYGLGWSVSSLNGRFHASHSGSQQETRTLLMHVPALDLSIALASNFENAELTKYRNRLYWLLTGEVPNPELHLPDRADRLARQAAENAFDGGMLQYDRFRRPATEEPRELAAAFRAFNRAVGTIAASPEQARTLIDDGLHPFTGQPFLKVGSYMAARLLRRAGADATSYHSDGELPFFRDYIRLYRADRSIPRAYRFDRAFERRIEQLAGEWERIWTPEAQRVMLAGASDPGAIRDLFANLPKGSRVLPDLTRALVAGVETAFQRGDAKGGLDLARLAAEVYPHDSETTGVYGVSLTITGEGEQGLTYLRRSVALRANGYASPGNLRSIAAWLGREKRSAEAIALLENAAAVHPADAAVAEALARARSEAAALASER